MSPRDNLGGRRGRPFSPDDIPWDQVGKQIWLALIGLAVVAVLLAGDASAETRNVHAATPLILAAQAGAVEVAELLLEHGADPNAHEIGGSIQANDDRTRLKKWGNKGRNPSTRFGHLGALVNRLPVRNCGHETGGFGGGSALAEYASAGSMS